MAQSVLVFVSHSSEDKEGYIEPIVSDLEDCYINVWIDKRKIVPGDNLRKSIFRDGLDKADIALLFFTENSLKSSWVDREIKHVLREETKKGNDFDLNKIISIFESKETYDQISERYPELTDDLLHLMPRDYGKIHLGQLVSAIWSKYFSFQGGDVETQKALLSKEKEIFQRDKEILDLSQKLKETKLKSKSPDLTEEFNSYMSSGKIDRFMENGEMLLRNSSLDRNSVSDLDAAIAFGLMEHRGINAALSTKGTQFFKWKLLNEGKNEP